MIGNNDDQDGSTYAKDNNTSHGNYTLDSDSSSSKSDDDGNNHVISCWLTGVGETMRLNINNLAGLRNNRSNKSIKTKRNATENNKAPNKTKNNKLSTTQREFKGQLS